MSQQEEATEPELELFIQHQMEQEEEDKHDLRLLREHQQHEKTITEKDEEECCPGHEYEYLEQLDPTDEYEEEDYVRELWCCQICNKTRVFIKNMGVRD